MLENILKATTNAEIISAIKSNPIIVQMVMQKFEAYKSFGNALTDSQQFCISNNLHKLNGFFKSNEGKELLGILAESFEKYCK